MPGDAERERTAGDGIGRRFPRFPILVALLSLALLLVIPFVLLVRIDALRREVDAGLRPARDALSDLQVDVAIGTAASRAFVLSGDPRFREEQRAARERRDEAIQRLLRLGPSLGPEYADRLAALDAQISQSDRLLDAILGGRISPDAFRELLPDLHERLLGILDLAVDLERRLTDEIAERRARHDSVYRFGLLAEVALLLLAVVAALQIYRLGRRYQAMAWALAESEERFRQVGDHVQDVIWLVSPDMTKRYYTNPAYERVWGRSVESAYEDPRSPNRAIHPDDYERVMENLEAVRDGKPIEMRYRVVRPDGTVRWVRVRSYPVRNVRGEIHRIAGIAEDITETIRAEEEREELLRRERVARADADRRRAEVERISASRERLIRGIGHDLKNPLAAVDGYLQLLERKTRDLLPPQTHVQIGRARRALHRALDLVENLLALARAETGELVVEKESIDLATIVGQVVEEYRAQAETKGLQIGVHLPSDPTTIESDGRRIAQILGNLLSNAVKYTDEGSIEVELRVEEAAVALDVRDTGRGIAPEDRERIFQEFRRVTEEGEEGAGIGLAISRLLASALGGTLTVESTPGRGSTFTLRLPVAAGDPS